MKTNSHQSMAFESRWRRVILLFAFLGVISLATTLGLSQVKTQKRVTSLQLGDSAEGARVTIVSDSALNDYEAFRRGDRFYVKIPLADFAAASPKFRGNGFEDVQVQKVGDSVIVSFRLQPGATARVDQRSNRLDVIFSTVGSARNAPAVNAVKSFPTSRNRRNAGDLEATAGPLPPMTTQAGQSGRNQYAAPSLSNSTSSSNYYRETTIPSRSSRRNVARATDGQNSGNLSARNPPSQVSTTVPSATPPYAYATPSPFSTPAATSFATPLPASAQQPGGLPASSTSKTAEAASWESRMNFLKAWAKLNRTSLIVGGSIALALLIGLVVWSRLKGRETTPAKTAGKKTADKTPAKPVSEKVAGRRTVEIAPVTSAYDAQKPAPSAAEPRKEVWPPQPAPAGFAATALHEHRVADQDREVIEL